MADPERDPLEAGEHEKLESEAEAQSEETIMPWIWGALGVLVVAAFIAWLIFLRPLHRMPEPPAAAPIDKPIHQHS
jgi:hypothetical protein